MKNKKSIKVVIQKIDERKDGFLTGGFASIKGGFSSLATETTYTNHNACTNSSEAGCGGTNGNACDNLVNCDWTTNNNACSNVKSC